MFKTRYGLHGFVLRDEGASHMFQLPFCTQSQILTFHMRLNIAFDWSACVKPELLEGSQI